MVSKTRMIDLVKAFDWKAIDAGLNQSPDLKDWRGERGRNWLHLLCGVEIKNGRDPHDSVRCAEVLRRHGFDLSEPAWLEGTWRATPVWFSIARGRNLVLTKWLLNEGADPNWSLFAAGWWEDGEAIRLLVKHGAVVDEDNQGDTPFLGAVGWSRFKAAEQLLKVGADVNRVDSKGNTALHLMLKKGSEPEHFRPLIAAGAKGDIPDREGKTARQIMSRKKDPAFRRMAGQLA
jgi:hypothetical protein